MVAIRDVLFDVVCCGMWLFVVVDVDCSLLFICMCCLTLVVDRRCFFIICGWLLVVVWCWVWFYVC